MAGVERQACSVARLAGDLRLLEAVLKSFAAMAKGKKWSGNHRLCRRLRLENIARVPKSRSLENAGRA